MPALRIPFGQLCAEARRERVDLGARGFYATPGVDFNRETGQGTPFFPETEQPLRLRLIDSKRFASGVLYLRYAAA